MDHGFYHPSVGYWQTISEPDDDTLSTYPEGTVQVPLKPAADATWDALTSTWIVPAVDELALRKEALIASAWNECEARLENASASVSFGAVAVSFGLDRETRENLAGIVNAINAERSGLLPAGTVPNPRPFAPKGQPLMNFSHEALAAAGAAVMGGKDSFMAAYFTHKATINAATEPAQLDAYDVTTGWPAA